MDARSWQRWSTAVEWDGDVDPVVRERLETFLNLAMARIAVLAGRLDGALDVDLITALSGHLQPLGTTDLDAADTYVALQEWAMTTADETHVRTWQLAIQETLDHDAAPVQAAATALLLELIGRAVLASRPELDSDGLVATAVDVLEQYTRSVLLEVLKQRMPSTAYRTM